MTAIDKAAIAWSIAIVAAGVIFAGAGSSMQGSPDVTTTAPVLSTEEKKLVSSTLESEREQAIQKQTGMIQNMIQGVNVDMETSGTIASITDPGMGHESHQLAILLPPSENTYSGTMIYDASEPIQLVSLKGPLGPDKTASKTWTPDGDTIFELTFVDQKRSKGTWSFTGNALAIHTMFPTQFTSDFTLDYRVVTPKVIEPTGPQTIKISLPSGSAVPGCEETNNCYIPNSVSINSGDTVIWSNDDTAAHTVTSGTPESGPDGTFDSSLFMAGTTFGVTFDNKGSYDYFCMVHPWMTGDVKVN
jgi:plastocyanin